MCFVTPPVAVPAYIAAGIAGSNPIKTGFTATRLGVAINILPFAFAYNSISLGKGTPGQVLIAGFTAAAGVTLLASALLRYMLVKVNWWQIPTLLAAGVMMIWPSWQSSLMGGALGGRVLIWQIWACRAGRLGARPD